MASRNYNEAIKRVLAHEGGYTNHPDDPGGPTNWGITIFDAKRYWRSNATWADVKAMPKSVAIGIYKSKYWDALRCDDLPDGVDYAVFDYGVNSGIGRAGKVLRRVLGLKDDSYIVTNDVLNALGKRDKLLVIRAICDEREAFLRRLKTWPVFGRGWGRRVAEVRLGAAAMATDKQVSDATSGVSIGAGRHEPLRGGTAAKVSTVAVPVVAGAASLAGGFPVYVFAAAIIISVVAAALFLIWHTNKDIERQEAATTSIKPVPVE